MAPSLKGLVDSTKRSGLATGQPKCPGPRLRVPSVAPSPRVPAPRVPVAPPSAGLKLPFWSSGSNHADSTTTSASSGNGVHPPHGHSDHSHDPVLFELGAAASTAGHGGHLNSTVALAGVNGFSSKATASDEAVDLMVPGSRAENNIAPYTSTGPSLALQIRDIASTLRHINSLRLEYMDKIAQQEMELATKDQALRAKEDRIHALESEAAELRRSLGMLHSAKSAAETEVQRLRAAAAAAAALPPPPAPAPALPPPAAPAAAAAAPAAPPAAAPVAPAPAAVAPVPAAAPAPAAPAPAAAAAPAPTPAPPAAAPPPPPPRVPEITLSYRSAWDNVYLHGNVDGKGWTTPPGLHMKNVGNKEHVVKLPAKALEFVINNGHNEWDSPGGPGQNYRIDTPGEYRLHYGTLTQTKPWTP
ncbi:hypothetical protein HYH03_001330 [Edaphochlamys debaryana]|uniref:Carbohydrate binding module family 25 domain-containing protein n=1 Tax=Edaphochlamys debaryana TaxID=47281 RepID=A0A836C652_9CHLO|nr:hypothetical protein HYH03_001330 [Edaphochlamys debaryana]|eukprot:KAG2500559.1 hypothetical protein HYH03_001330 [Edaphochlamys debaryana]